MGKYQFYQDRKVTSWERDYFTVEAASYKDAEAIVRSWKCEDVSNIIDSRLCYDEWGAFACTSVFFFPVVYGGWPSNDVYFSFGKAIINNAPEKS